MAGRFEIRSTVEGRLRPWRPGRGTPGWLNWGRGSSLPFLLRLFLQVGGVVLTGMFIVSFLTLAIRVGSTGLALDGMMLLPALMLVSAALWFMQRWRRASLIVGADGIEVRRLTARRFVPHSRIRSITREGWQLVLDERGQSPLRLRVDLGARSRRGDGRAEMRQRLDRLVERMEEARAGYGKASSLAPLEALMAGAEQATPTWLAQVRAATRREDYRAEPLTVESLWPIVEDASMPARERLAAAVALRGDLDDAGKSRLRVAVDATLSPRVRVALEAALDEDDEQLAHSFAELAK